MIFDEERKRTAASKAREDINEIVSQIGFEPIEVEYDYKTRSEKGFTRALKQLTLDWKNALEKVGNGDTVFIQFPLNHHPMWIAHRIKKLHHRGGRAIVLIHDIDSFRMKQDTLIDKMKLLKVKVEDKTILNSCDAIIAHNRKMIRNLVKMGIDEKRLIPLEIFDYVLHSTKKENNRCKNDPVAIAGTLRKGKAGYVYKLPKDTAFNLYGVGYEGKNDKNTNYQGSFMPEELQNVMKGSFGLVWDGDSADTCDGISGGYLRINNPHKTSLYLACGMPVLVWKDAAISSFVESHKCGISINSLNDINKALANVTNEEYKVLCENAEEISKKLIRGDYTKTALSKALAIVEQTKKPV